MKRLDQWMSDHIDLAWKIIFFNLTMTVLVMAATVVVLVIRLVQP